MALDFKLPDIGEGIAEGEIVKWLVSEGDTVDEHQPIVEVMTDKATVEIPAPQAGTVTKLLVGEGDVVPVGDVIFVLDEAGGGSGGGTKPAQEAASPPRSTEAPASAKQADVAEETEQAEETEAAKETEPSEKDRGTERPTPDTARADAPGGGDGSTIEFALPDIGEGIAEGEIVQWLVEDGEAVEEHQAVVEVMTDKATVEIPAPAAGTVTKRLVDAGEVVPIGTVIFHLATAGGGGAASASSGQAAPDRSAAGPSGEARSEPGRSEQDRSGQGQPGQGRPAGGGAAAAAAPARDDGKVLAVPSARRVARELGVALADVPGTGRNGVVRRADVEAYSAEGGGARTEAAPAAAAAAPAKKSFQPVSLAPTDSETRTPFRGIRRKIAEAMARSKQTAAHFTVVEELDVTELVRLRAKAKVIGEKQGVKVTYMPFLMKAVASGLAQFPELNSQLDESTQEIVTYGHVNLGIATDTKNGLIVPIIRHVQSKGLLQLAAELQELAQRTRDGKVKPDELSGGTFTITNAGNIGGILATPVINFPEVAILGVHRIVKRPGVVETDEGDTFEVRHYMNLSISVDHRLVDGASAVRFLVHMKQLLEDPGLLSL